MKYLKLYNESIKDLLKPKSEEEIKNSMLDSKLSDQQKFLKACEYGFEWLVKDMIEKGFDDVSGMHFYKLFYKEEN